MNTTELICKQCRGNIDYNSETKTGVCSCCGRKTFYTDESIAENPEEAGYKWQKGVNRANEEHNKSHSVQPINNYTQSFNSKPAATRKKSMVGRVFLTIGIVYTALVIISYLITAIAAVTPAITDSEETTKSTTTVITINNGGEENDSGPEGTGSTRPIETTEFVPNEVLLVNLKPYDTRMPYTKTTSVADIFDHEYANGIYSHVERTDGPCSCTYRIDGNYDRFTFTSGIVEFGRGDPGEALIKVYADGKVIYERTLDCTSDSSFADLDVRGVKDLTLELYGHSEPEVSIRGATALYPCIWEATLYSAR